MSNYIRVVEKQTSVKSIGVIQEPTATTSGICDFIYRDQYSVFDWGKMPMPEGKIMDNRAVALVAIYNYELVRGMGFDVCYVGAVDSSGDVHNLDWFRDNKVVPNALRVRMVNVLRPTFDVGGKKWNYSIFQNPPVNNYVHPLEFIWRQEAGRDSSFWKNITKGVYYLSDFGLPDSVVAGDILAPPILDHSSKYEDHDRYFTPKIAQTLANIPVERWQKLSYARQTINGMLSSHADAVGLWRPDGKQEFAVISDIDYLADVAGTWHEDRFEYTTKTGKIVKVSKQTPRDLNKILNAEWAKQCDEAKQRAEKEGLPNWKPLVTLQPQSLESEFFDQYNNLMYAATNAWIGWQAFTQASQLEEACIEFDKYLSDYKKRLQKRKV